MNNTEILPESLNVLASEIRIFSTNLLVNIIEIGRRFEKAKAICPRGAWGDWVKRECGYEQSMVENYIKIFREYGGGQLNLGGDFTNSQSIATLGVTKLLELTKVPAEEREDFVRDNNITNDTTVKELREKIKALQSENDKLKDGGDKAEELQSELDRVAFQCTEYKREAEKLRERVQKLEDNPVQADDSMAEMIAEAEAEAKEQYESEIKKLEENIRKAEAKAEELKKKLSEERELVKKSAMISADLRQKHEEALAEIAKLKKADSAKGNQELLRINILFEDLQAKLGELGEAFEAAGNDELRGKVTGYLAEMLESIRNA